MYDFLSLNDECELSGKISRILVRKTLISFTVYCFPFLIPNNLPSYRMPLF